jgi:hypothetical protein
MPMSAMIMCQRYRSHPVPASKSLRTHASLPGCCYVRNNNYSPSDKLKLLIPLAHKPPDGYRPRLSGCEMKVHTSTATPGIASHAVKLESAIFPDCLDHGHHPYSHGTTVRGNMPPTRTSVHASVWKAQAVALSKEIGK